MFSGRHEIPVTAEGHYFLDRDPKLFAYLLQYLRDGKISAPRDEDLRERVRLEADYFGLESLANSLSPALEVVEITWSNPPGLRSDDNPNFCNRQLLEWAICRSSSEIYPLLSYWEFTYVSGRCLFGVCHREPPSSPSYSSEVSSHSWLVGRGQLFERGLRRHYKPFTLKKNTRVGLLLNQELGVLTLFENSVRLGIIFRGLYGLLYPCVFLKGSLTGPGIVAPLAAAQVEVPPQWHAGPEEDGKGCI
eukprot:TRINITY_DN11554_c0_g1_i1.p1 TRINITY_DN11554_c0_g1~~TRINITY_DN11554_c0_g1_i1.p1  ORF type:complete len:271 (+),score=33.19 TRINITY_DN11554_c0_g1_i1:70-813(+)